MVIFALLLFLPLAIAETTFYDNPNNAFVYPNPSVTSSVISQQESSSTGGGCLTNWSCSSWSGCINDIQTRNCTKIKNYCYAGTKPNETKTCTILPALKTEKKPEEKSVCENGICEEVKNETSDNYRLDCFKTEAKTEKAEELGREKKIFSILDIIILVGVIILLWKIILLWERKKR